MRRQATTTGGDVALFPFLAVLMCTMGALIVLLVVMTHQARLNAAQRPTPQVTPVSSDASDDDEQLREQIEEVVALRDANKDQLAAQRRAMAYVEESLRQLRKKGAEIELAIKEILDSKESTTENRQQAESELEAIRRQIEQTEKELEALRKENAGRSPKYSVVPYRGPNGTLRQPMFVECRADSVVLQPEGIALDPRDFKPPLDPGNPLAAALRAAQEHHLARRQSKPGEEPYPLLLVRPEGIVAFYRAREALKSWGDDFGYELIEQDWEIDYPAVDYRLAQVEQQAIDEARHRREIMARAAPSRYTASGQQAGGQQYGASRYEGDALHEGGTAGSTTGRSEFESRPAGASAEGPQRGQSKDQSERSAEDKAPGAKQPIDAWGNKVAEAEGSEGGRQDLGAFGQASGQQPQPGQAPSGCIADRRGENWALPDRARGTVPVSRPVKVICCNDSLTIVSDDPREPGRKIEVQQNTVEAVDGFVSELWEHMNGWGIAGRAMYWRPQLRIKYETGAEQRAADLERLLQGSGLDVLPPEELRP